MTATNSAAPPPALAPISSCLGLQSLQNFDITTRFNFQPIYFSAVAMRRSSRRKIGLQKVCQQVCSLSPSERNVFKPPNEQKHLLYSFLRARPFNVVMVPIATPERIGI